MREQIELRLNELARRAGISGIPPAVIAAALVLALVVVGGAAWRWWPRQSVSAGQSAAAGAQSRSGDSAAAGASESASGNADAGVDAAGSASSTSSADTSRVFVHVVGAVRRPGLYELADGGRVADAVEAAGGMLANAAQAGVNLARLVADGEQIVVPTADEFARGVTGAGGGGATSPTGAAAGGSGGVAAAGGKVNINTADAAALDALPGVGPSTAAKIVADREANGPFASADDLGRVAGIGPKKLEDLKPRVSVR